MNLLREDALRWLEEAEYDLSAAEDNLKAERFNWACFISQQAAEKAIKSIYISRQESAEKVHSLAILIKGDKTKKISGIGGLKNLVEGAMELDKHYIPTRYPNSVPYGKPFEFYTEKKAKECLFCAREIVLSCRNMLENI